MKKESPRYSPFIGHFAFGLSGFSPHFPLYTMIIISVF